MQKAQRRGASPSRRGDRDHAATSATLPRTLERINAPSRLFRCFEFAYLLFVRQIHREPCSTRHRHLPGLPKWQSGTRAKFAPAHPSRPAHARGQGGQRALARGPRHACSSAMERGHNIDVTWHGSRSCGTFPGLHQVAEALDRHQEDHEAFARRVARDRESLP